MPHCAWIFANDSFKTKKRKRSNSSIRDRTLAMKQGTISSITSVSAAPLYEAAGNEDFSEDQIFIGDGMVQLMVLGCCAVAVVTFTCNSLSMNLIAREMDHWCQQPPAFANLSSAEWKELAIPVQEDGSHSHCTVYDPPTPAAGTVDREVVACRAWDFDMEQHGNTIVSQWKLVCNRYTLISLFKMAYTGAAFFTVPVLGVAADRSGRRPVICGSVALLLIAGFASALAKSFTLFVAVRCVVSAMSSSLMIVMIVVLHEVAVPVKRVLYMTIAVLLMMASVPMTFSVVIAPGLDWTIILLITMVPASLLVGVFYMVEESPRWLLVTGRPKEAERVALWAAKINKAPLKQTKLILSRVATELQSPNEDLHNREGPFLQAIKRLLFNQRYRKNSIILFCAWFSIIFTLYTVTFNKHWAQESWVKLANIIAITPVYVGTYISLVHIGRKRTIMYICACLSASSALLAATYNEKPNFTSSVLFLITRLSAKVSADIILIFTVELYPTVLRCVGVSSSFAFGRIAGVIGTALAEFWPTHSRNIVIAIIAALTATGALAMRLLPETATFVEKREKHLPTNTPRDPKKALQESLEPLPKLKGHRRSLSKKRKSCDGASGTAENTAATVTGVTLASSKP